MFHDHFDRAVDRAAIFAHDPDRILSERHAPRFITEQFAEGSFQLGRVSDLNGPLLLEEGIGDGRKILHVRPENDRFAQRRRFDGILPALAAQALPDKDDRGLLVEVAQFAGGVDQQAFHLARLEPGVHGDFAAKDKLHAARAQVLAHRLAALEVARHHHEKQIGEPPAQTEKLPGQDGLFTLVRAAADQQPGAFRDADLAQHRGHVEQTAFVQFGRVEFQAAHHLNGRLAAAEFAQPGGVRGVLRADASKRGEQLAE